MEQLENNLGSVGWSLPPDQVAKLDAASELQAPYPYDFIAKLARE
jgi:aryl-alcohol dehydrogenase-like predicted oxidoreductase